MPTLRSSVYCNIWTWPASTYRSSPQIAEGDCEVGTKALRSKVVDKVGDERLRILALRARSEQRLLELPPARSVAAEDKVMPRCELIEHETREYVGTSEGR